MTTNRLATFAAFSVMGFFAQEVSAFYAPHMGRFLNRDPAGQMTASRAVMGTRPVSGSGRLVDRNNVGGLGDGFDAIAQYEDGMNLYQYVKSMPIISTDPTGLSFMDTFRYGNYCGPAEGPAPGPPIDALDSCCKKHDDCYEKCGGPPGVGGVICPSNCRRKCDEDLCSCSINNASCDGYGKFEGQRFHCMFYRAGVRGIFCFNGARPL